MTNDQESAAPGSPTAGLLRHPSRNLATRSKGYGIGGGYEKRRTRDASATRRREAAYTALPHSGYYGAGLGDKPFKAGQASFTKELGWYDAQYGKATSGFKPSK
jgi:hypothetical protein